RKTSNPLEKILTVKKKIPGFIHFGEDVDSSSLGSSYTCRVNTISDSFTVCFGFKDNPGLFDLAFGLDVILNNLLYVWSTFIGKGYTIRGAIDYGDIYWDENELIGPAFIRAYHFESEVAKTSRVVVSSNLNKVLKDLFNHQPDGTVLMEKDKDKIKKIVFEKNKVSEETLSQTVAFMGRESAHVLKNHAFLSVDPKKITCSVYLIGRKGLGNDENPDLWHALADYYNATDRFVSGDISHNMFMENDWEKHAELILNWIK
ncbi:MAG: hypothetical protein KAR43_06745, partial [Deltaproteobacteria bacterium]|nr:hypothetical protein [Deltaproteobacteria bacterium]